MNDKMIHPIENDFPVIFKDLLDKFPQLDPRQLIYAAIKHNFLRHHDRTILPIKKMFYVGTTALFEEWIESGEKEVAFEDFFQKSFSKVSKEIYQFLKIEHPGIFKRSMIKYSAEIDFNQFPHFDPDPYDIVERQEALCLLFSSITLETRNLFICYILGYSAEETVDKLKISSHCDVKVKRGIVKTRFRLSIEKVRKILGVNQNAPIFLHDHYHRITLDEKREKDKERMREWRKAKKSIKK